MYFVLVLVVREFICKSDGARVVFGCCPGAFVIYLETSLPMTDSLSWYYGYAASILSKYTAFILSSMWSRLARAMRWPRFWFQKRANVRSGKIAI